MSKQSAQNKINLLQPFLLEEPNIRGRMVRLDNVAQDILSGHDYPPAVSKILGEALVLTTLLAGMLKYEGVFTFQIKGDGAIPTLVCDLTNDGAIRGYASFDTEKIDAVLKKNDSPKAADFIGDGHLAFTVDQGSKQERYQGLVEMRGDTMTEWVRHYFTQSEQIKTAIKLFVQESEKDGWQASALMLQSLPEQAQEDTHIKTNTQADNWRRVMMLMETATAEEMMAPSLSANDMLFRLFHEEKVRVFDTLEIRHECRCNKEKIEHVLATLSEDEIDHYTVDGKVDITCQFCSKHYIYTQDDITQLQQERNTP